jgi:hypothetical protein
MAAGMALGAAPGTEPATLEQWHRDAVTEPGRIVLVAELDSEVVGMAHIAPSEAANAHTAPRCSASRSQTTRAASASAER